MIKSSSSSWSGLLVAFSYLWLYCNEELCDQTIRSTESFSSDQAVYNACTSVQHACVATDSNESISDFYLLKSICQKYCFGSNAQTSYRDNDFKIFLSCQTRCLDLTKKKRLPLASNLTTSYRFYGDYLSCFEAKCAPILLNYELDSSFNQYRIIYSSCWESQLLCSRARAAYNITLINTHCYKFCSSNIANSYAPFTLHLTCDGTCLSDTLSAQDKYLNGLYIETNGISEYEIALQPDNTELTTGFWVSLSIGLFFILFVSAGLLTLIRIYNKTTYFKYESNFTESDDEDDDDDDEGNDDDDDEDDDDSDDGDDHADDDGDNDDDDDADDNPGDEDEDPSDRNREYDNDDGNPSHRRGKKNPRKRKHGEQQDYDPTGRNSSVYHRSSKKYAKQQLSSLAIFMKKAEEQHQLKQQQQQKQLAQPQPTQSLQYLSPGLQQQSSQPYQTPQPQGLQQSQLSQRQNEETNLRSDIEEQHRRRSLKKKVSRLSKQRLDEREKGNQAGAAVADEQPQQQHLYLSQIQQSHESKTNGSSLTPPQLNRQQLHEEQLPFSTKSLRQDDQFKQQNPKPQHQLPSSTSSQQEVSSRTPSSTTATLSGSGRNTATPTTKKAQNEPRKSFFSQISSSSSVGHTAITMSALAQHINPTHYPHQTNSKQLEYNPPSIQLAASKSTAKQKHPLDLAAPLSHSQEQSNFLKSYTSENMSALYFSQLNHQDSNSRSQNQTLQQQYQQNEIGMQSISDFNISPSNNKNTKQ